MRSLIDWMRRRLLATKKLHAAWAVISTWHPIFEAAHEPADGLAPIDAIEVDGAEVLVVDVVAEQEEAGIEHGGSDGEDGFLIRIVCPASSGGVGNADAELLTKMGEGIAERCAGDLDQAMERFFKVQD
jgi:hypothetical protein